MTLLILSALLSLTAIGLARGAFPDRSPAPLLWEIRGKRVSVNEERTRRCLPPVLCKYALARLIPFAERRPALRRETDRLRVARSAGFHRCHGLTLWAYERIPAWRKNAWFCIHRGEGSWQDTGDPYWGGLQMDRSFMGSYGSDAQRRFGGFAHRWPWWAQVLVAERAYKSGRGFHPWPNTARHCGLI